MEITRYVRFFQYIIYFLSFNYLNLIKNIHRYQLAFPSTHMKSVMPTDQTGKKNFFWWSKATSPKLFAQKIKRISIHLNFFVVNYSKLEYLKQGAKLFW